MKKKSLFATILLLLIAVFAFTFTACENEAGTLKPLLNEYGIVIDGGGFEEGSTLVSNEIATDAEEGAEVLAAIADQNYNKDGSVYIFDIYVTKDGAKVQPSGKVKVSVPLPNIQVDNYLVFHVKADNTVENLVPTVADGKISFETSSFSYFIIAEAAPAEHVHDYVWVEGTEPTCEEEGAIAHYHCDGCGKNFNPNYGEIETISIPKAEHEYGSMYWGKSANFREDGNIEYYQCAVCEKYFDAEFNEVETVVIPKYSTNLSICVNGTPTALVLGEQHENFIEWSLEGLSVTKGDVITLCQTDNAEIGHNYFADGNVDKDGKILTTAASANVVLTATPNGLTLFIDGYKYEGIVIEINGVQYPMIYTAYPDETTTYIYGYVEFAVADEFVIIDNVSGSVYDYDDLDPVFAWDTWDFHRGDNGEFAIDYAARYGIEFDYGGNKKIYINKVFAPLDGSSYELTFENSDTESVSLTQMQFETGSEAYEDLLWYIAHEDVVNNADIVSYISEKGLYVYIVKLQLEEGMKFNIKNLTANSTITADHLVEVYTESGCITKDGDYIKVLVGGYYSIVYMPCVTAPRNAPFHKAFLQAFSDKFDAAGTNIDAMISMSSWMHGLNTTLGQVFFESVAHILCDGDKRGFNGSEFRIYAEQERVIAEIMTDLKNGDRTPDMVAEDALIKAGEHGELVTGTNFTADCYFEDEENIVAIELKSVRPNSGETRGEKQKILKAKAALRIMYPKKKVGYFFGFPFDPTADTDTGYCKERFMGNMIEFPKFCDKEEILLSDGLWSYLSGEEGTMRELLDLIRSIATANFMDEFNFISTPDNLIFNTDKYIEIATRWCLEDEFMIAQNIDTLKSSSEKSVRKNLYVCSFDANGQYNERRVASLLSVI